MQQLVMYGFFGLALAGLTACASALPEPAAVDDAGADTRSKGGDEGDDEGGDALTPDLPDLQADEGGDALTPDLPNADAPSEVEEEDVAPDLPPEDLCQPLSWWPDSDQDNYGNGALAPVSACEAPQGYVLNGDDCDDTEANAHPGADELPGDGVDQDCDGMERCFVDGDGDGALVDEPALTPSAALACDAPGLAPATAPRGDCDDADPDLAPGAAELCDGQDQDCDGRADNGADCPCATHWREADTGQWDSYLLCTTPQTWTEADAVCRQLGYTLATVAHQAENTWLAQTAYDLNIADLWIGLSDITQERAFVWSSGAPLDFTFWNNNQPNNDGNQDCVELHARTNFPLGTWNDTACNERLPFWCEAP
jgi:hypothetical protein